MTCGMRLLNRWGRLLLYEIHPDFTANVAGFARYGIDFVADCIEDDNSGIYAHN